MSYYNPSNLVPTQCAELIASTPNVFSWSTSGTSTQTHYQVFIRRVSDNVQIYDSTKTASSSTTHTVPASTFVAGTLYKWSVNSYYDVTNYLSSKWELFKGIGTVTLTLASTPTTQQQYEFSYTYNHPQSYAVKTYNMKLYQGSTVIDESGEIYPETLVTSGTISYAFEGMQSGETYGIECTVTTQNENIISSGIQNFTVTYTYPDTVSGLILTPDNTNGSISLSWINIVQVIGVVEGGYEYVNLS